ncbi:tRNA (cytidine(34)-2'-O)-methyltransferase [Erysipelotrichaceae bacterium OttesenSCG-928-M19]|nr:tRNA (cytidine(34)-2'-O)-methyltransferase [Erysipelotrichaceae bacterium OttesenSCG-928-M19]
MALNVVLYEPEIPQNTGNIIRTCVATNTKLHLIEPLGFDLYKKDVRRSTANHLEGLNYQVYPDYDTFVKENHGSYYYLTRYGKKAHSEFNFSNTTEEIYFIFGKESSGIPYEILKAHLDHCLRIPMAKSARSLNLSNCVSIIIYEALRQQDYPDLSLVEVQKGADFLNK